MKVRMKVTIAGLIDGQRAVTGSVIDVPDSNGADLCSKGYAEPVAEKESDKAEKRVLSPNEIRDKEDMPRKVACPVDGCDYTGTERGLKIHAHSHEG